MLPRRRFRSILSAALTTLVVGAAMGCAASPTPKTFVDNVARADTQTASDTSPTEDAARQQPEDLEPVPVPIAGTDLVEGKATVTVAASLEKTRATVLKFEDYPEFMPEYSGAKRLGLLPSGNEKVYMEITTLGGIAKMYANVEVLVVRKEGDSEVHEAKFLDGNVRQFKAIWTLTPTPKGETVMSLQVFLHPSLPLPDFLVNKANLDGAKKGALAMKRRVLGAR